MKPHHIEKVYDVSGTPPQHIVGVSNSNKKLTFVLKETRQYIESFKLKRQKWPWKIQKPALSCFSPFCKIKMFISLSLSLSLYFSLHHHSILAPPWLHLLSQPNLDSRCLKSPPEIEIHCWLSTVPTRSTFFSSENAQNRLSLIVSNHRRPKFSSLPTPDVARRFSSLVLNLFSEFFYLHMCFIFFLFWFYKLTYTYICRKEIHIVW